ncbi:short-chain dehydrogenase, putative [Talaromyces stipitatus ATCC 10500]|uniref:Short-chain dehydrogenase, putative n=1 Tax=Talaromyces stipitatus (strain ATCC 10500 / CBS 375.48 / QM 6759 / NRRL 1006) TaxID=441959 RepID=B8MEK1_TALSN|nr:short-chain dehydrogenase, putative [Talaromyces stipitatus ATCC 10500]EED16628.1 short-chain dehydrogenase, putative [Talaromyces stipitatus ATCC 10500]
MPNLEQFVNFDPEKDIPNLDGKVIFITGGTSGLGRVSVTSLAKHNPAHIYFTGRNHQAAEKLIHEVQIEKPSVRLTFVKMDMTSLSSVKTACKEFIHDRLDVLMCNAGVMFIPAGVSSDGFELHFAINHLAHAMIIQELLPLMKKTASLPGSDVRVLCLTSTAWMSHPKNGITFSTLRTPQKGFMGSSFRYGQSKLANIIYAAELARQCANTNIKFISVHPGAVNTHLTTSIPWHLRLLTTIVLLFLGVTFMEEAQGRLSQLWAAAGCTKNELVNGGFYMPVGRLSNDRLDKTALSPELALELWVYTQNILSKF